MENKDLKKFIEVLCGRLEHETQKINSYDLNKTIHSILLILIQELEDIKNYYYHTNDYLLNYIKENLDKFEDYQYILHALIIINEILKLESENYIE